MRVLTPFSTAATLLAVLLSGCMQRAVQADASPGNDGGHPAPVATVAAPPAAVVLDPALAPACRKAAAAPKLRNAAGSKTLPNADLYAALYQQHALEYRANALATYRAAAAALPARLAEQRAARTSRVPVVVFDLDETVLDNSRFQGRALKENREYDPDLWDCWVGVQQADLVPGAEVLFQAMAQAGVRGRFISNRKCLMRAGGSGEACPQLRETLDNLNRLLAAAGANYVATEDEFLLHGQAHPEQAGQTWADSEKKARRAWVRSRRDVVMLLGDDLGDFLDEVKSDSAAVREQKFVEHDALLQWGRAWFMLPNAMYGSWQGALSKDAAGQPRPIEQSLEAFEYP